MRKKAVIEWGTLTSFNETTRQQVIDYLHDNNITLNAFSKLCEVGQPNLHTFINGKTLAVHNLEKIWKFLEKQC